MGHLIRKCFSLKSNNSLQRPLEKEVGLHGTMFKGSPKFRVLEKEAWQKFGQGKLAGILYCSVSGDKQYS